MKLVDGGEFDVSKRTVAATKLGENDRVVCVMTLLEQRNIVLQTKEGYFLRFAIEEIPEKKKGAVGVRGMRLASGDQLEAIYLLREEDEPVSVRIKDKEVVLNRLHVANRDTKGVKR